MRAIGVLAVVLGLVGCDTNAKRIEKNRATIDATRARNARIVAALAKPSAETCAPGKYKLELRTTVEYVLLDALSGANSDAVGIGYAVLGELGDMKRFLLDTDPTRSKDFLDDSPDAGFIQALERAPKLPYLIVIGLHAEEKVIRFTLVDAQAAKPLCQFEVEASEMLVGAYQRKGSTGEGYGEVIYREDGDVKKRTSDDMVKAAKDHLGLDLNMAYH